MTSRQQAVHIRQVNSRKNCREKDFPYQVKLCSEAIRVRVMNDLKQYFRVTQERFFRGE